MEHKKLTVRIREQLHEAWRPSTAETHDTRRLVSSRHDRKEHGTFSRLCVQVVN